LTLVTGLFDLARREPATHRTTVARYLERADQHVLGIEQPLVAFVDPELAEPITTRRRERGLGERTVVVPIALEELRAHGLLDEIERARRRRPLLNGDPVKDTSLFTVVQWAKLELVRRAAALDPFAATHLAWIDIALRFGPHPDDDPFADTPDRVRAFVLRPFFAREMDDRERYFSYLWGHTASGYLSGSRENMLWLAARVEAAADEALAGGFAASEEQLLPLVASADPERFEFHHGDYGHELANYVRPRGSAENLAFQLRILRAESAWERAIPMVRAIVESVEQGTFDARGDHLAELLDECFLSAWYGDLGDRSLARRVYDAFIEALEREPGFREVFLRDEIRLRKNFAFVTSTTQPLRGSGPGATMAAPDDGT
jgi:hypothetical protein